MRGLIGFDYIHAKSLRDVWNILEREPEARLLAGGTDLLVNLKTDQTRTPMVVSLKNIRDIYGINRHNEWIEIGALTTVGEIANNELVKEICPLLRMASKKLGSKQIRNLATIGGNLCNASPAGDLCIALICLEAKIIIKGSEEAKKINLENFFLEPGVTSLKHTEILTSVLVPLPKGNWKWNYQKLGKRKGMECSIVTSAVGLKIEKNICKEARIALGAVAPTPIRARKAEKKIVGKKLNSSLIEEIATYTSQETNPISDIRASAEYRKEIVRNLTRRALNTIACN